VIASFLSSWELFHNTYLAGWLIAVLLALVGVVVVARDQIFIGAAVSQASTLGIALAMRIGTSTAAASLPWLGSDVFLSAMAVAFSVCATLFTASSASGSESHEAATGWVFLASASLSILVVTHSPHGLEEIHRLLSSSIIGATAADVWTFGALAAVTALAVGLTYQRLLLFALDPVMAAAVGMRVGYWSAAVSAWLGLAVGLSIRSSGMLYTFGCLVLPALAAKNVCREVRPMFLVSPAVAVAAGVAGFMAANRYDYPPGQMTVAVLCLALAAAWLWRWGRQRRGA
jgi:ABC-type Mn2+/Zn2+ transport system permease subunit